MAMACKFNSMATLSIFFLLFHFPFLAFSTFQSFDVPSGGPESYVFEPSGDAFYTSVNDGRTVKYAGSDNGFVSFAYASPNRTSDYCDGTSDPDKGYICGRVLGIVANYRTGKLNLVDAYHGLLEVGPEGGLATQISTTAGGISYTWLNGLDVDQETGKIYYTDVSTVYNMSQIEESVSRGDATGRFIEFDPDTNSTRVLMTDLVGPGGTATSTDASFVLVSEFVGNRIWKYWLTGTKANTSELFLTIPGPANIKRLPSGNYWVPSNNRTSGANVPTGVKFDKLGNILNVIPFVGIPYDEGTFINEVQEHAGKLYISSIYQPNGVIYTLPEDEAETLDQVERSSTLFPCGVANLLSKTK